MNLQATFEMLENVTNEMFIEDWKMKYIDKLEDVNSEITQEFLEMDINEFVDNMSYESFYNEIIEDVKELIETV